MISLNYTSFVNPKVALEIRSAMAHVLKTGECVRLVNRNKEPWLLVTIIKDAVGYRFAFLDVEGGEQGSNILKACIRRWTGLDSTSFWSLNAESYDLVEHPFVSACKRREEERLAEQYRQDLKDTGVTHSAHSWGGKVMLAAYQRDWLGRKRLYVLDEETFQWRKVTKEALLCIRHVEPFL